MQRRHLILTLCGLTFYPMRSLFVMIFPTCFFKKFFFLLKCACAHKMLSSGNHVKLYLLSVLVLWLFPDIFRRQKVVESIGLYFSHFKFLRVFP